jgi:hypothetical protein
MPVMQTPVMKRNAGTSVPVGSTTRISALATDATVAASMKKRRGSSRSANPRIALVRLPTTYPACTPLVSDACKNGDNRYSASNAGTTADAENQSAIAATSQSARMVIATGLAWSTEAVVGSGQAGMAALSCAQGGDAIRPSPFGSWFPTP